MNEVLSIVAPMKYAGLFSYRHRLMANCVDNAIEITEGKKGDFFPDRWHTKDRPACYVQYRCWLQLPLCGFRAALSCSGTPISPITIKSSVASCYEDHVVVMSFETVSAALSETKIFFFYVRHGHLL